MQSQPIWPIRAVYLKLNLHSWWVFDSNAEASLRAGHRTNWPAVKTALPGCCYHLCNYKCLIFLRHCINFARVPYPNALLLQTLMKPLPLIVSLLFWFFFGNASESQIKLVCTKFLCQSCRKFIQEIFMLLGVKDPAGYFIKEMESFETSVSIPVIPEETKL